MIKLSELKDKDYIIVNGDNMITKEDILENIEYYKDKEMYTAKKEYIEVDVRNMLESDFDITESYDGWYDDIWEEVTEQDIKDIENVIHRILNRNPKKSYYFSENEKIEFDIEVK